MTRRESRYALFTDPVRVRHYKYDSLVVALGWYYHTTVQGEDIMDIAYKHYQDATAYFIIAAVNRMTDNILDPLPANIKLIIPNAEILKYINVKKG